MSEEQTDDPTAADLRNFYKVELWTRDGLHVERLIYAGSSIDRARQMFETEVKRRPRGRYLIRQRILVLARWPETQNTL